jgi:2-polyprenyl-3-methyl-5-hydroxy-6-metoxy-1,4-benzoquinol methylase
MEQITVCPICQGADLTPYLSCKDHTVSKETFHLRKCGSCGFVLTSPRPTASDLPKYYQSDAYISHSNKPSNLVDQIYKIARKYTLKWKYNLIAKHSSIKPSSILDYGCGTGAFLQECQKHGMKTAGVEPSDTARLKAREETGTPIAPDLNLISQEFDVITLWHVLEHVNNLNQTLSQLKTHLDKNGTMFIAVPNLQSADAKVYQEFWAGYDVPRHLWHFSRTTMEKLLRNHGFQLISVLPMPLDAYYVSLLSEKYRNNDNGSVPGMITATLQGWKSNQQGKTTHEYSSLIYIVRK